MVAVEHHRFEEEAKHVLIGCRGHCCSVPVCPWMDGSIHCLLGLCSCEHSMMGLHHRHHLPLHRMIDEVIAAGMPNDVVAM